MKVENNCSYTISFNEEEAQLWKLFVGCFSVNDIRDMLNDCDSDNDYTADSPEVMSISRMIACMYDSIKE